jgi:capsule polysaccharide export protein KpsE/RkpR
MDEDDDAHIYIYGLCSPFDNIFSLFTITLILLPLVFTNFFISRYASQWQSSLVSSSSSSSSVVSACWPSPKSKPSPTTTSHEPRLQYR